MDKKTEVTMGKRYFSYGHLAGKFQKNTNARIWTQLSVHASLW